MDAKAFKDLCDNTGIEVRSYSGRGMYGRKCLGIDTDDVMGTIADLIEAAVDFHNRPVAYNMLAEALRSSRQDSMGLGVIIYFPSIAWEDSWDDDSAEEYNQHVGLITDKDGNEVDR